MKKILLTLIIVFISIFCYSQNSFKIIYSNPITHCYVTAVSINDSVVYYSISETSERRVFRITDRSETQQLGLFDKETTLKIFKNTVFLFDIDCVGQTIEIDKNVILSYVRIFGINCVKFENRLTGVDFNINKKTAEDIIKILDSM